MVSHPDQQIKLTCLYNVSYYLQLLILPGDEFVLGLGLRHADLLHVIEALGHWARLAVLSHERELSEFGHHAAVPQALREALLSEHDPVQSQRENG